MSSTVSSLEIRSSKSFDKEDCTLMPSSSVETETLTDSIKPSCDKMKLTGYIDLYVEKRSPQGRYVNSYKKPSKKMVKRA